MGAGADQQPLLIVLSGASGAGKTTIARHLLATDATFRRAITATTRAPRGEEQDGTDYHFLTPESFDDTLRQGGLLEHAEVYGHRYGTPAASVRAVLEAAHHCLLVVDVQGVRSLRPILATRGVPVRYVFVRAPSLTELERRLRERGEDDEAAVLRRLRAAQAEEAEAATYDLVVVNDSVEAAVAKVRAFVGQVALEADQGTDWPSAEGEAH